MQKEITKLTDFLDESGNVIESGWARKELFDYHREKVGVSPLRIKEWDFWEIYNSDYKVIMNIFDIGYAGVADFSFQDFNTGKMKHAMMLKFLTRGSVGMPKSWNYQEPLEFKRGNSSMVFDKKGENIILKVDFPDYKGGKGIHGEISLYKDPTADLMANLIPFKNKKHFVYAQKMNCLPATGSVQIADENYVFNSENKSYGVLDWTRAVFPYDNSWKWCSASGMVGNESFGFNLDYGFGTESSKNMIFYKGIGHHLDEIFYEYDKGNLAKPLKITSNNNRLNLILIPKYYEKAGVDLLFAKMKGRIAYGFFTGSVVLDDGKKLDIKESDKLFGWAEEFSQRW